MSNDFYYTNSGSSIFIHYDIDYCKRTIIINIGHMPIKEEIMEAIAKESLNQFSHIKNTIAVMSGKGGVGKSSVTALLAITLQEQGYQVGILDADITGPSIPKLFGINHHKAEGSDLGIDPVISSTGIKIMSVNLLLENEDDPVVWRGPVVSNAVKQFYTEVIWGDLDYLLIDMPPGTGDVPLTVMQSLTLDGIIAVSTPQDLVKLIVKKSTNMAKMLHVPLIGIIENMSYFICPNCNEKHYIFGQNKDKAKMPVISEIPMDPEFVALADEGKIELYTKTNYTFSEQFSKDLKKAIKDFEDHKVVVPSEFNMI